MSALSVSCVHLASPYTMLCRADVLDGQVDRVNSWVVSIMALIQASPLAESNLVGLWKLWRARSRQDLLRNPLRALCQPMHVWDQIAPQSRGIRNAGSYSKRLGLRGTESEWSCQWRMPARRRIYLTGWMSSVQMAAFNALTWDALCGQEWQRSEWSVVSTLHLQHGQRLNKGSCTESWSWTSLVREISCRGDRRQHCWSNRVRSIMSHTSSDQRFLSCRCRQKW